MFLACLLHQVEEAWDLPMLGWASTAQLKTSLLTRLTALGSSAAAATRHLWSSLRPQASHEHLVMQLSLHGQIFTEFGSLFHASLVFCSIAYFLSLRVRVTKI